MWLVFTIAAFSYITSEKLVSFDPEKKLKDVTTQQVVNQLERYLHNNSKYSQATVLHFSTPKCDCQAYSEQHINEINQLASDNNFDISNIVITEHNIIPATPAIAIISSLGELIYFGPYGQGIACSQTSGYAQTILKNYVKGYISNTLVKEAKGCYCTT